MSKTQIDIDEVNVFICHNHDDIVLAAKNIKSNIKNNTLDISDLEYTLDIIIDRAKCAKRQGIKMENRLKKYRKAIEKLGFERV